MGIARIVYGKRTVPVRASARVLSTAEAPVGVTGHDGQPAVGRTVAVIGRDQWGRMVVVAEARTDAAGDFSVDLVAGPNDRFAVVFLGDEAHGEYSRALGSLTAVVAD